MNNDIIIAPSVLAADFTHLAKDIEMINQSDADWIHFDVMDGVFVPNISFGFPILKAVRSLTTKFIDAHLMVASPSDYFETFKEAGADGITIHYEGNENIVADIQKIKDLGMKVGVVVNPDTAISVLENFIDKLDLVLLMSVNPGFGGQKFIPKTLDRIKEVRNLIDQKGLKTRLQVDGGVGLSNCEAVKDAGADVLVAGSAVFKSENPLETISLLKNK